MVNTRCISLTFAPEEPNAESLEAIREGDAFLASGKEGRFTNGGSQGVEKTVAKHRLGDARHQRVDAGGETALPVAVAAVRPAAARLVGFGVRHGVHDLLDESAKQLLHVDGAVVEPGHGEHVRRRIK